MPQEWWENFFDGIALDMWRQVLPEEYTQAEAAFLQKVLALTPPAKILDAPCGEGRVSRALAALGYRVTGLDYSATFLEEARRQAAAKGMNIEWKQGDMRRMDWAGEFDGAVCVGGSFGYFDDAGHASFLKSVFNALKPGGRFVLDASRVMEVVLPNAQEREWVRVGDILFLEENRWDHVNGRMETEYTFVRNGKEEKKTSSDRIYTYREISHLLEDAGFSYIEAYSSHALEPFKLGSRQLILVARKA